MKFLSTFTLLTASVASVVTAVPLEERSNGLGHYEISKFDFHGLPNSKKSKISFNMKYTNIDHPDRNFDTKCSATPKGKVEGELPARTQLFSCEDSNVLFKWKAEIDAFTLELGAYNTIKSNGR
jgi:hypothetical protein